jgi:hypothetical protein
LARLPGVRKEIPGLRRGLELQTMGKGLGAVLLLVDVFADATGQTGVHQEGIGFVCGQVVRATGGGTPPLRQGECIMIRKKDLQFQINFLKRELERVDKELAEAKLAAVAATAEARAATAEAARLRDVIDTELLPDDSAARQAKIAMDRFNQGIFNVLTFGDKEGKA